VLTLLAEDLLPVMTATAHGQLAERTHQPVAFQPGYSAVTVVLASEGYPGPVRDGQPIRFPQYLPERGYIFHAGTRLTPDQGVVSAGGRVLNAVGLGKSLAEARDQAYALVRRIHFDGGWHRPDIAEKAAREAASKPQLRVVGAAEQ